jgi:hypothetical protein
MKPADAPSNPVYGIVASSYGRVEQIIEYGRIHRDAALSKAIEFAASAVVMACPVEIDLVELDDVGPVIDGAGRTISLARAPGRMVIPWETIKEAAQRVLDTAGANEAAPEVR